MDGMVVHMIIIIQNIDIRNCCRLSNIIFNFSVFFPFDLKITMLVLMNQEIATNYSS